MNILGKTIAVTGGGNGIGRELVLELLAQGANIAAIDLSEKALKETAQLATQYEKHLSVHATNIADHEAVKRLPDEIISHHGRIDGVINNAGIIQPFVRVNDLDFEAIERVMNVNFYGTVYMIKTFLPYLIKQSEAHIVNISSMGGFLPVPGQSIYGASKAAVKLLTEALYAELMTTNVHVTLVFPGAIATNITGNSGVEIPKMADPGKSKFKSLPASEAASQIIDGMKKNKFHVYVGSDSKAMNWLYRFNPLFATRFISKQMKDLLT
jgi:short-subunit dehydrogenase